MRAGSLLAQAEFIPNIAKQLQESPEKVIAAFNEVREYCASCTMLFFYSCKNDYCTVTDPSGIRFSLAGNILGIDKPRSILGKYFGPTCTVSRIACWFLRRIAYFHVQNVPLAPVPLTCHTLNAVGKNPNKKVSHLPPKTVHFFEAYL
jgi:hypothetical protein